MNWISVMLGGGIGACMRYGLSLIPYGVRFPIGTFLANVCGAFLIGLFTGIASVRTVNPNTMLFLKTGMCGGFTTFSTFSSENVQMIQQGHSVSACNYMGISLVMCLFGVVIGETAGKRLA